MPEGCNDSFLSLIPKVPCPKTVKQFRPIGLCIVSYKLLTETMSVRLKCVLRKLIGAHQSIFILGRQIADNILIYQEVLKSMKYKTGKLGWMIMKVDLKKAYDRLSWKFIEKTLMECGLIKYGVGTS